MLVNPSGPLGRRTAARLRSLVQRHATTEGQHQRLALYALTRASATVAERISWALLKRA